MNNRFNRLYSIPACGCLLAMLGIQSTLACDICAVYRSLEAETAHPGVHVSLFEQFTHFGTLQEEGSDIGNPAHQSLDSSITQFIAGYQMGNDLGVQVNVPYIHRSYRRPTGYATERATVQGIGDLVLLGHYRVFRYLNADTLFSWELLGGVKFPTGDGSRIGEELDEEEGPPGAPESGIHGHDLALGSGSIDGILGTGIFISRDRFFITGGIQYALRGRGDFDYRYGDDLNWYVRPGFYLLLSHAETLGVQLVLAGEHKGQDDLAGAAAADTAMTSVMIGPGTTFTWKENLSAELAVEFPLTQDNSAVQLVPDYRINAALTWQF